MAVKEYYWIDDHGRPKGAFGLRVESRGATKWRALAISRYYGRILTPNAPWVGSRKKALAELAKTHPDAAKLG